MDHKNLLKIIGAGITGGYLALRLRRPRKSYREFLTCYWALSIDVLRELESSFVETMLPAVSPGHAPEFSKLLDEDAEFLDKLKFFQRHLDDFNELSILAVTRFYSEKEKGNLALASHRKIPGLDFDTVAVAVQETFYDLESAFSYAIMANAADGEREALKEKLGNTDSLTEIISYCAENMPNFGSMLFDAIAGFENQVMRGREA